MILLMIIIAAQFDKLLGIDWVRESIIIAFIVNESISIIENAGLMGLPIPQGLKKAIDILSNKSNDSEKGNSTQFKQSSLPKNQLNIFHKNYFLCLHFDDFSLLIYVMRSDKYQQEVKSIWTHKYYEPNSG